MKESCSLEELKKEISRRIEVNTSNDLYLNDPRIVADEAEDSEEEETD